MKENSSQLKINSVNIEMIKVKNNTDRRDVVIIGAGPYGLSLAAYLKAQGTDFRIFGNPMNTWLTQMPKGMLLKSEGFASFLYDPNAGLTLEHYCRENKLPYADQGLPVPLETFAAYGMEFQKRLVPQLENKLVTGVKRSAAGFEVSLEDGEVIAAKKVVMAVGISQYWYVPEILAALPEELVTHSSRHGELGHFKGKDVIVIGAGASALDLAALLHQAGARAQVAARSRKIRFHEPPRKGPRPLLERLKWPMTGIGAGWKIFFCANLPGVFHKLPEKARLRAVRQILGPAPGWFVKEQVVGKVPLHLEMEIANATVQDGRVRIELADKQGKRQTLTADHVISATGFRVDLRRLTFMDVELQSGIRAVENTPVLSGNFESSVPGLYFVGTSAANSFGPLMRFAFGAQFAAKTVSRHLAKSVPVRHTHEDSVKEVEVMQQS
jgi:thioredoxin reductase